MAPAASIRREFPHELALAPDAEKIQEAFGWAPASWAFGLLIFSSLGFVQPAKPTQAENLTGGIALGLAISLLVFEFRRRKRPRVLARFAQGAQIGIYKSGQLNRVVNVEDSGVFIRHLTKTWGAILSLAMTTALFAIFLTPSPVPISLSNRLLALLACLFFGSLTASVVRTRLFCEECLFPQKNGTGRERILVSRKAIPVLFSRSQ